MNDEGVSVLYGDEDLRSEFDFRSRFASHYRPDVRLGEVDYPRRRTVRPRIQHVLLLTVHVPRCFERLPFPVVQQFLSEEGRCKQALDGAQVPRKAGELLLERSPELLPADVSLFAGDSYAPGSDAPVGAGLLLPGLSEDCPDRVEEFLRGYSGGDEKLEVRGIGDVGWGTGGIQDERSLGFGSGRFGRRFISASFRFGWPTGDLYTFIPRSPQGFRGSNPLFPAPSYGEIHFFSSLDKP